MTFDDDDLPAQATKGGAMTEDELKAIEAHGGELSPGHEVLSLVAEVRRLRRALIDACAAANAMGDELNACDMAGDMDCFEEASEALARANQVLESIR